MPGNSIKRVIHSVYMQVLDTGRRIPHDFPEGRTDLNAQPAQWWRLGPTPATALIMGLVLSLLWSHVKLLWYDEFLVLWTDSVPSFSQILHIQRTCPISLDPLTYHALAHLAIGTFGAGAFALRLPSMLGYVLLQWCLYLFVRRCAGHRAGVIAMVLPLIPHVFYYSAEGRPYGLMLGMFALALVAWQTAIRSTGQRGASLAILALAVAASLNSHYYGFLLLGPLLGAEAVRAVERRRIDLPVLLALAAGTASLALVLPFVRAAGEFRQHYYNLSALGPSRLAQAYLEILPGTGLLHSHAYETLLLTAYAGVLTCFCVLLLRRQLGSMMAAEGVCLLLLSVLPIVGYILARAATHTFEERFVLGGVIGIAGITAMLLTSVARRPSQYRLCLAMVFLLALGTVGRHIVAERKVTRTILASLQIAPAIHSALDGAPGAIAMGNPQRFAVASYYEPDPQVRSRLVAVYSRDQELLWEHADTISLTLAHLSQFSSVPVRSFESVLSPVGEHAVILFQDQNTGRMDWAGNAIAAAHDKVRDLGPALGGEAELVEAQR